MTDTQQDMLSNEVFAKALCARLDKLFWEADADTQSALRTLFETRIEVPELVADHPQLTVTSDCQLGIMGVLNALAVQNSGENVAVMLCTDGYATNFQYATREDVPEAGESSEESV